MNPLADIEFTQQNLERIAEALENNPRHQVYQWVNDKTRIYLTRNLDRKYYLYPQLLMIGSIASIACIREIA